MAGARLVLDDDWTKGLHELERQFFEERLGPDILADAHAAVPIDTGRLDRSLDFQVIADEGGGKPELEVGSYPDEEGDVEYAAPVEFGFRGREIVRAHLRMGIAVAESMRNGYSPEQPYLRPAAYRERYGS